MNGSRSLLIALVIGIALTAAGSAAAENAVRADADSDEAGPGWMIAIDPILVARDRLSEELARLDTLVRDQARRLTTRLWRSATG